MVYLVAASQDWRVMASRSGRKDIHRAKRRTEETTRQAESSSVTTGHREAQIRRTGLFGANSRAQGKDWEEVMTFATTNERPNNRQELPKG
jgi:hypothetical protein